MNLKSTLPGLVLGILVLVGFFLPWARPVPEEAAHDSRRVKQQLLEYEESGWLNYLFMQAPQWQALLDGGAGGVSAWQIAFEKDSQVVTAVRRMLYNDLFGEEASERGDPSVFWMKCLLFFPVIALINLFFLLRPSASKLGLILCGLLDLATYVLARWKMAHMFALENLLLLSLGLWISLYGILILALVCGWQSYHQEGNSKN